MTRTSYAALAAVAAALLTAEPATATELWNPHLRGAESGMAAGALPPEGVYFILNNYATSFKQYSSNKSTGVELQALVEVPILLWNTGLKVLGADYAVAIAQPFDYTHISVPGPGGRSSEANWGAFNTYLSPVILSWALPYDLHIKGSFGVWLDTATTSPAHPPSGGGVGSGNSFTTFEPGLGISWLHDGWNASLQFYYSTSTKDTRLNYQSGDQIAIDYTLTKSIGKWTLGLGAFQLNQLEKDKINGVAQPGTVSFSYGLGPIVGYDFGPVSIQAHYNHQLLVHNDVGDDFLNIRAVVPLY